MRDLQFGHPGLPVVRLLESHTEPTDGARARRALQEAKIGTVPEHSADADLDETSDDLTVDLSATLPHVVLLGAGASRAALPSGDRHGRTVPLLRDVANDLGLRDLFPDDLRDLATSNFEAAYSQLSERGSDRVGEIDDAVRRHFQDLELPLDATLYDVLVLALRGKDAIFTFNWDPFLAQACQRLHAAGVRPDELPQLYFLHGNVAIGACPDRHEVGPVALSCSECGERYHPTRLLYPVEHKNYEDGQFIEHEWKSARQFFRSAFVVTIFGYSAPDTDAEAVSLLQEAWGDPDERNMEQVELISRADADQVELRSRWDSFIHSHHYEIHGSFYDSRLCRSPRRSVEAAWSQYVYGKWPRALPAAAPTGSVEDLVHQFQPLLDAERQ